MSAEWPIGLQITAVEPLSDADRAREGWAEERWNEESAVVLVLSDGSRLYPSRDPEGNGTGTMFGYRPDLDSACMLTNGEAP